MLLWTRGLHVAAREEKGKCAGFSGYQRLNLQAHQTGYKMGVNIFFFFFFVVCVCVVARVCARRACHVCSKGQVTFIIPLPMWHWHIVFKSCFSFFFSLPFDVLLPAMNGTLLFCTYGYVPKGTSHLCPQYPFVFFNGPKCRHTLLGGFLITVVLT